jgi:hypothetical protein
VLVATIAVRAAEWAPPCEQPPKLLQGLSELATNLESAIRNAEYSYRETGA